MMETAPRRNQSRVRGFVLPRTVDYSDAAPERNRILIQPTLMGLEEYPAVIYRAKQKWLTNKGGMASARHGHKMSTK